MHDHVLLVQKVQTQAAFLSKEPRSSMYRYAILTLSSISLLLHRWKTL